MQIGTDRGHGTVKVIQGSTLVQIILEVTLNNRNAFDYVVGETVIWTAGTGIVTSFDSPTARLRFYLVTGVNPSISDAITGATAGGNIASWGFGSPPTLDTLLPSGIFPKRFHKSGSGILYHLSSSISSDRFTLTGPYQETSEEEILFIVHQDFDPDFGAPIPNPGDSDVLILMNEAISILAANLASVTTPAITWTAIPLLVGSTQVAGSFEPAYYVAPNGIVYLRGAMNGGTGTAGTTPIAQLPSGIGARPSAAVRFTQPIGTLASPLANTQAAVMINTDGEIIGSRSPTQGCTLDSCWFDGTGGG